MSKQYIYIMRSDLERAPCEIGTTNNLEKKLKERNNMTGNSKKNVYKYLFTCEVKDMKQVEKDFAEEFSVLREIE